MSGVPLDYAATNGRKTPPEQPGRPPDSGHPSSHSSSSSGQTRRVTPTSHPAVVTVYEAAPPQAAPLVPSRPPSVMSSQGHNGRRPSLGSVRLPGSDAAAGAGQRPVSAAEPHVLGGLAGSPELRAFSANGRRSSGAHAPSRSGSVFSGGVVTRALLDLYGKLSSQGLEIATEAMPAFPEGEVHRDEDQADVPESADLKFKPSTTAVEGSYDAKRYEKAGVNQLARGTYKLLLLKILLNGRIAETEKAQMILVMLQNFPGHAGEKFRSVMHGHLVDFEKQVKRELDTEAHHPAMASTQKDNLLGAVTRLLHAGNLNKEPTLFLQTWLQIVSDWALNDSLSESACQTGVLALLEAANGIPGVREADLDEAYARIKPSSDAAVPGTLRPLRKIKVDLHGGVPFSASTEGAPLSYDLTSDGHYSVSGHEQVPFFTTLSQVDAQKILGQSLRHKTIESLPAGEKREQIIKVLSAWVKAALAPPTHSTDYEEERSRLSSPPASVAGVSLSTRLARQRDIITQAREAVCEVQAELDAAVGRANSLVSHAVRMGLSNMTTAPDLTGQSINDFRRMQRGVNFIIDPIKFAARQLRSAFLASVWDRSEYAQMFKQHAVATLTVGVDPYAPSRPVNKPQDPEAFFENLFTTPDFEQTAKFVSPFRVLLLTFLSRSEVLKAFPEALCKELFVPSRVSHSANSAPRFLQVLFRAVTATDQSEIRPTEEAFRELIAGYVSLLRKDITAYLQPNAVADSFEKHCIAPSGSSLKFLPPAFRGKPKDLETAAFVLFMSRSFALAKALSDELAHYVRMAEVMESHPIAKTYHLAAAQLAQKLSGIIRLLYYAAKQLDEGIKLDGGVTVKDPLFQNMQRAADGVKKRILAVGAHQPYHVLLARGGSMESAAVLPQAVGEPGSVREHWFLRKYCESEGRKLADAYGLISDTTGTHGIKDLDLPPFNPDEDLLFVERYSWLCTASQKMFEKLSTYSLSSVPAFTMLEEYWDQYRLMVQSLDVKAPDYLQTRDAFFQAAAIKPAAIGEMLQAFRFPEDCEPARVAAIWQAAAIGATWPEPADRRVGQAAAGAGAAALPQDDPLIRLRREATRVLHAQQAAAAMMNGRERSETMVGRRQSPPLHPPARPPSASSVPLARAASRVSLTRSAGRPPARTPTPPTYAEPPTVPVQPRAATPVAALVRNGGGSPAADHHHENAAEAASLF